MVDSNTSLNGWDPSWAIQSGCSGQVVRDSLMRASLELQHQNQSELVCERRKVVSCLTTEEGTSFLGFREARTRRTAVKAENNEGGLGIETKERCRMLRSQRRETGYPGHWKGSRELSDLGPRAQTCSPGNC